MVVDKPKSLSPKAVNRIGVQLQKFYFSELDDPLPKPLCRLIEELQHTPPFNEECALRTNVQD